MVAPLKHGHWKLSDLAEVPKNGLKVFSCFHCGGGSTMGYKLAGYDVIGGVEIDPEMMQLYRLNHNPKHSYLMPIQKFKNIPDSELPSELFNLDILDGSPPCSSFSTSGSREKKWNEKSKFREGQANQVLDDLFFHFIDVAQKLKPKVVVAENVKGLVTGNAKGYVKEIFQKLRNAGYDVQLFLLNASRMGVPQVRERTVFIARRSDINFKSLSLDFFENPVSISVATNRDHINNSNLFLTGENLDAWHWCIRNKKPCFASYFESRDGGLKRKKFNWQISFSSKPAYTIAATGPGRPISDIEPRYFTDHEIIRCQSFPDDYDFCGKNVQYICGMSVPPFMMQRIADQIERQWFRSSVT